MHSGCLVTALFDEEDDAVKDMIPAAISSALRAGKPYRYLRPGTIRSTRLCRLACPARDRICLTQC